MLSAWGLEECFKTPKSSYKGLVGGKVKEASCCVRETFPVGVSTEHTTHPETERDGSWFMVAECFCSPSATKLQAMKRCHCPAKSSPSTPSLGGWGSPIKMAQTLDMGRELTCPACTPYTPIQTFRKPPRTNQARLSYDDKVDSFPMWHTHLSSFIRQTWTII